MSSSQSIELFEYGKIAYEELGQSTVVELEEVVATIGLPVFRFYRNELQAQSYVGFISTRDWFCQILPKIAKTRNGNLVYLSALLAFVNGLPIHETGVARYKTCRGSLLEIWIRHFAEELNCLLRRRLRKEHVSKEEEQAFVKGKLLLERLVDGQSEYSGRFHCRFDEFTADHKLNQLLKWANRLLMSQAVTIETLTVLRENDFLMSSVTDCSFSQADLGAIHLNRLNRHYEPLLAICRLLLSNSTLDFRAGRIGQISFVFDMNRLFERFVGEFIRRHCRGLSCLGTDRIKRVTLQKSLGKLFDEFRMFVDLSITMESGREILLDTKYKILEQSLVHLGLSQADFYQMYAYARAGSRRYDEIILLYPKARQQTLTLEGDYRNGSVHLKVRQIDLEDLISAETGRINSIAGIAQFSRILD